MRLDESTTRVFRRCQAGDESAAAELVERYSKRLCALAAQNIDRKLRQRIEAEDVIQSVFRTFFRRTRAGEFTIDASGELWRLLARITLNHVSNREERERAQRRDGRREVLTDPAELDELVSREPSQVDLTAVAEELEQLLSQLRHDEAVMVRGWLAGEGVEQSATTAGCSRWTVQRKRRRIKKLLQPGLNSPTD